MKNKLNKVKDTKEYKEYLSKQARRNKGEKIVFTSDEASKFAPLNDLFEFVSYSLTRPETQKWLNSIEYKKDQTALDRFKDLLNKIFFALKDMGFEIKSGTALSTAFKNSVVLLNAQELYESDATVSKPTFNTDLFTLKPEDFTEGDVIESLAIKDFVQGKQFQKLTAEEKAKTIEQVTKEHRSITALKDLSAKIAHRIGGNVRFENRTNADWKGYNHGMTSVLNEAYMTPDTPFHEILAHPIIRVIKKYNPEIYQSL